MVRLKSLLMEHGERGESRESFSPSVLGDVVFAS